MGRMKELFMQIYEANQGIPENISTADAARMKELQMFEWKEYKEYEAKNKKTELQSTKSKDSRKNSKDK